MMNGYTLNVMCLTFLFCAGICDRWTKKIPNFLVASAAFTGLWFSHLPEALLLFVIVCAAYFMLGAFGLSGWGDVKALMATAALGGATASVAAAGLGAVFTLIAYAASRGHSIREAYRSREKIAFGPWIFFGYAAMLAAESMAEAVL